MRFRVLSSGSSGNMTYIETKNTKIILDAGIGTNNFFAKYGIDLKTIDGVVITHEHTDHTMSIKALLNRTQAPLYINKASYDLLLQKNPTIRAREIQYLEANCQYLIGDIKVFTLLLNHDAANCFGFIFANNGEYLAYVTDTGVLAEPYLELLKKADSIIIEANHDTEMLLESERSWYLKQRILSCDGHLSNQVCGTILNEVIKAHKVKTIVLAHLSDECNTEECAMDTVLKEIEGDYLPKFYIAKRRQPLPTLEVKHES